MQTPSRLKPRHLEILNAIVRWFIETGEPVGSHSIARTRREPLSPATIRNAMADLAEEGYLSQPHTSAGRIPTEKAFRLYVSALTAAWPRSKPSAFAASSACCTPSAPASNAPATFWSS
jgi:heat-inducible transcriptional repressor